MGQRLRRGRNRWASVAAVATLVAGAAVLGGTGAAQAALPDLPTGYARDGALHLQLGSTDRFWWEDTPGHEAASQAISANRCLLQLAPSDTLVNVSAGGGQAGFVSDSIGVKSGGSQGTPCSRVSGEESLTLKLAGLLATGPNDAPDVVIGVDLDVEVKDNAVVVATTSLGGATNPGRFVLRTGTSVQTYQPLAGDVVSDCTAQSGSDSGPDSGILDNCRWQFNAVFDSLTLHADVGAFSLEGGSDQPTTGDSLFSLAEKAVTCPSDANADIASTLTSLSAGNGRVDGNRGEDAADPGVCPRVDYDLAFDGKKVTFKQFGTIQPNATFLFTVQFQSEQLPSGGLSKLPPTLFSFDPNLDPKQTQFKLEPCKGDLQFDGNGNFTGIGDVLTNQQLDLLKKAKGVQYACAFSETVDDLGGGVVQVTQGIYLIGDWVSFR